MSSHHAVETLLRPPVELWSAAVASGAAVIAQLAPRGRSSCRLPWVPPPRCSWVSLPHTDSTRAGASSRTSAT